MTQKQHARSARRDSARHVSGSTASYSVGIWLFLRLLGLVYLIAFASLWVQIDGLIGSNGILPVADFLELVAERTDDSRYRQVPTLLWLDDSDLALDVLCGGGVVLSIALMAGWAQVPVLILLWAFYLSLAVGGQTFLSFQWDILLLEAGFCALFVAPWGWRPVSPGRSEPPTRMGLWLIWLLLFKLMFLSGAVKPLSMDRTWLELTALDVHYWTQPIPTWISWYAHQLPGWVHKLSVLITYGIEIVLPFAIFAGYRGRRAVAAGSVFLMLMISWTGNYGFFNLLTVVLCVPLIDDAVWARWLGASGPALAFVGGWRRLAVGLPASVLMAISALTSVQELVRTVPPNAGVVSEAAATADRWLLSWSRDDVLRRIAPFRTINGYGLFRSMTTERPEIVIEGSRDGTDWSAYEMKWKPGDPARRPRFIAPHMPRLDWQMWFAALGPQRAQSWLVGLMRGLLSGSPEVLGLMDIDPFAGDPPRYVRLVYYRYTFASPEEKRARGVWWTREQQGFLTSPISLEQVASSR